MSVSVYLVKRYLRATKRNGQRKYRWAFRWKDPATGKWKCESSGTADKTAAESLMKVKWLEVNGLVEDSQSQEPPVAVVGPGWDECEAAFERAMTADNLRPGSINHVKIAFKHLREMFPNATSPADITPANAAEYKRKRAESARSPWTIRAELGGLRAIFGKWLIDECDLLKENPFAKVKPPRCDEVEVRIVSADESAALFSWLKARWNNWHLPVTYLRVLALIGWRASEVASIRDEDILTDGYLRVTAATCKTRKLKYGWLPQELYEALQACSADGWAFGRFSDDLRRLLTLWMRQRNHAARVKDFAPKRLVGWMQDELQRFHEGRAEEAEKAGEPIPATFTLHDFRRTAITGMQMAGVPEKDASVMVGATPEVIRRHYDKLDRMTIAKRNVQRRLSDGEAGEVATFPQPLRASCARA